MAGTGARGVGWWVDTSKASKKKKKKYGFVFVCVFQNTERGRVTVCGGVVSVNVHACMAGRKNDAFSYSCLLASVVCSSEALCSLDRAEASASFSKRKTKKKKILLCDMAKV